MKKNNYCVFTNNLFTTSDPPKYLNSNSPNLCFCLLKGDKKTFSLVQKIFLTNKNVFLSPFNKQKQRFGESEFEYFGGSDVTNTLIECEHISFPDIFSGIPPPNLMGSLVLSC